MDGAYMYVANLADYEDYYEFDDFMRVCEGYDKEWLKQIYTAVHRPVKDIAKDSGMSQSGLARCFGIPRRTMEDWCRGRYTCPLYTRMMMQEILGLVKRKP